MFIFGMLNIGPNFGFQFPDALDSHLIEYEMFLLILIILNRIENCTHKHHFCIFCTMTLRYMNWSETETERNRDLTLITEWKQINEEKKLK